MKHTSIQHIQGPGLHSPLAKERVVTRGVVTGHSRKGFFLQDPDAQPTSPASAGLFVFSPRHKEPVGALVEVEGPVTDYRPEEADHERPVTQLFARHSRVLRKRGPRIEPVWIDAAFLEGTDEQLAERLNRHEGMLMGIRRGATFLAGSNPFGDYVVLPEGLDVLRTPEGGVLIDPERPHRWYPSFRVLDYGRAPRLNVGAELKSDVIGPLNYRSSAFQIVATRPVKWRNRDVALPKAELRPRDGAITVLTLNGFNLDPKVEDRSKVADPDRDVDDDIGDGRFRMLAEDVVHRAYTPEVVALQEIQDSDGAEITENVDAELTFRTLIEAILRVGGPRYRWADVPPQPDADGGQPGGNIRNAYLYDPDRVELVEGSLRRIGENEEAFVDSRKPLLARFRRPGTPRELVIVNLHLASKRHQHGVFSPHEPGFDPRLPLRVQQARLVRAAVLELDARDTDYYVTGDFNDYEFSETLRALCGQESVNLVHTVPPDRRYDYNHRGVSQVLMHGVVSKAAHERGACEYEILHGNELIGVKPGELGGKATDHAYVLARLDLREPGV